MRPRRRVLLTLAALALAGGCRGERERAALPVDTAVVSDQRRFEPRAEPGDRATRDTTAPDEQPGGRMTYVLREDSVIGHRLYHRAGQCMTCHGNDAVGLPNLGPELRSGSWLHIDGSIESIARVIVQGIAQPRRGAIAMPAMGTRLREDEIFRIAAYVHSLSHPWAVTDDTSAVEPASPTGTLPLPIPVPLPLPVP